MKYKNLLNQDTEERTEEVVDIIERMPTRFGFWVSAIVLSLALLLLIFGYIIRYPDVLRGQITINTVHAPVKMVVNNSGPLEFLGKNNGDIVEEGTYIAVIKNPAKVNDVQLLDSLLKNLEIHSVSYKAHRHLFSENLSLGELNNSYFVFLKSLYEYLDYFIDRPYDKQKDIGKKLLNTQQGFLAENKDEYFRRKRKLEISKSLASRDSVLMKGKVIAASDLEKSAISSITNEQEFGAINKELINNQYQINEASNKLLQLDIQQNEKERELEITLYNSYYQLQENIKEWKRKYAFISPIKGKLDFMNFFKNNDFVQQGQDIFTIVPEENETVGQVFLPEVGSGKIKKGQEVIIKLDNYPYTQFGSVKGVVKNISLVTNSQVLANNQNKINAYLLTIALPNGLTTNYGTPLEFRFEAKGTAEIITDDRRLIQRLFDNLKYKTQ